MESESSFQMDKFQAEVTEELNKMMKTSKFYLLILLFIIVFFCERFYIVLSPIFGAETNIRCRIDELENINWSFNEIKSLAQSEQLYLKECFYLDYNYSSIKMLPYRDAKQYREVIQKSAIKNCQIFEVSQNIPEVYKQHLKILCAQSFIIRIFKAAGVICGALLMFFSDIYGRKLIVIIGIRMWYIAIFLMLIFLDVTENYVADFFWEFGFTFLCLSIVIIIAEIVSDNLLPFIIVLPYFGEDSFDILSYLLDSFYWKHTHIILITFVIFFPLIEWYFPESPIWLATKSKFREAQVFKNTLNNTVKHNSFYLQYRSLPVGTQPFSDHFRELRNSDRSHMVILILIATSIGFLCFGSKLESPYADISVSRKTFRLIMGVFKTLSTLLSLLYVYFLGSKVTLLLYLGTSGTLKVIFETVYSDYSPAIYFLRMLTESFILITSRVFLIYAIERIPTSHRGTYAGLLYGTVNLSFLVKMSLISYKVPHMLVINCIITVISFTIITLYSGNGKRKLLLTHRDVEKPHLVFKEWCCADL